MSGDLADTWHGLRQEVESRSRHLVSELAAAWNEVRSWSDALAGALSALDPDESRAAAVRSLEKLFTDSGGRLIVEPLERCRKSRPLHRALSAIQDYETALEDLLRQLPPDARLSGRELVALLGPASGGAWRRLWLRWQNFPRDIPLRGAVRESVRRRRLQRAALDGSFQLLLAQSCVGLLEPWQIFRREALAAMLGTTPESRTRRRERRRWEEARARQAQSAARLLAGYGRWADSAAAALAGGVLRRLTEPSARAIRKTAERRQRHLTYWFRQQRAVQAVLSLELQLLTLAAEATAQTAASLRSLEAEHEDLRRELEAVIAWLEHGPLEAQAGSFPAPQARLASAEERIGEWRRRVSAHARSRLPAAIEVIEPRRALPGWTSPWRELEPGKVFSRVLASAAASAAVEGFQQAEQSHRAVVRDIERAREVVAFGMEAAGSGDTAGRRVAEEAIQNALTLLLHQRKTAGDIRPPAETGIVRGQAAALLECQLALEKSRVGWLAHLTRQRGLEALQQAARSAGQELRSGSRAVLGAARRFLEWTLLKIGWLTPPRARLEPVSKRTHLEQVLDVPLEARALPMIYQRLFRLAPVEDPRFLVGREAELAGLAEAFAEWQSGRGASALVVGARGSGKTSLLNCAVAGVFAEANGVAGQFSGRMTSAADIHRFLRALLGLPEQADVAAALAADRRVILIEELERTFLRVINGFGALRELLNLISATSARTFWVLSVNETASRFLDAVVGLDRAFSHRINAMSVEQQDLTSAILQRHNLSGLRLEFAPLPREDPRVSRVRSFLGLEQDAQRLFFDALYRQSEGIFRSAFEMWKGCIDLVEGGAVHMRQPLLPDYAPLRTELSGEDYFLLHAVLQHGSLTVQELARVMSMGADQARRATDRLLSLQVLEPEPQGVGLRIRPEAGRLVRDALHRQNLW